MCDCKSSVKDAQTIQLSLVASSCAEEVSLRRFKRIAAIGAIGAKVVFFTKRSPVAGLLMVGRG
jgi:hypothetical protein